MMNRPKDKVREDGVGVADEQGDVVVGKLEEELQVSKDEEGLHKEIGLGLGEGEKGVDEVDWSVKTIPNKELLTMKSNCRIWLEISTNVLQRLALELLRRQPAVFADLVNGEMAVQNQGAVAQPAVAAADDSPDWCMCGLCRGMATQLENPTTYRQYVLWQHGR